MRLSGICKRHRGIRLEIPDNACGVSGMTFVIFKGAIFVAISSRRSLCGLNDRQPVQFFAIIAHMQAFLWSNSLLNFKLIQ